MSDKKELERLQKIFKLQKEAYHDTGAEGYDVRRDRLDRALAMVEKYETALCEAMDKDFAGRNPMMSLGLDFVGLVVELKDARRNLKSWMKPEKRKVNFPLGLTGAKARVVREPKGVIGNMTTWNFPVNLSLSPLAGIFAGGNRCLIKMHENSPETTRVLKDAVAEFFQEDELAIFGGGLKVSEAFTSLNLDHLLYTGSTAVGKLVMAAAAKNLTPVTLELGGKCPVIISRSADKDDVAAKVTYGKMSNAGQICLAPDYLLVAEDQVEEVVSKLITEAKTQFPNPVDNDDYTAIISDGHFDRLTGLVDDARAKGAKVTIVDESEAQKNNKKMPLHIIENVSPDMAVMQEEIFGPVLPIITYKNFDEAIVSLKGGEKPLASYYFGKDKKEENKVITHVPSGGMTVNDVLFHVLQKDLPFGGVGNSGMGAYHGKDGFNEFTHARSIFTQGWFDAGKFVRPPFKAIQEKIIRSMMK